MSSSSSSDSSFRLPSNQSISLYDISLIPNLINFTFEGDLIIHLHLKKSTKKIILNSEELKYDTKDGSVPAWITKIDDSTTSSSSSSLPIQSINYELIKDSQRVEFTFPEELTSGNYKLRIHYNGILNDNLAGFYRSKYIVNGETKYMGVTQFEATDARRALPCIDEPAAKAKFNVTLIIPNNLEAISNMPIKSLTTTNDSNKDNKELSRDLSYSSGMRRYEFNETPIMSTYLLAFIVGEFDFLSSFASCGTEIRVYTAKNKSHLGKFSLDVAVKALDYYTNYTNIKYPLPKMDLITVADFAAGAMENWGAITYRETALLIDPSATSVAVMQRVARTVCHEIAHMWTYLWLNEGFARYLEHRAVDHIFPEWNIWQGFVSDVYAQAQGLDSLNSSHPVEVIVNHPDEVNEIFDTISYAKGASVIRMLQSTIGEESFRIGLQNYLNKFRYKNTESIDLWKSFAEVSGKDIESLMKQWTQKIGYPVLLVEELTDKSNTLKIKQERFLATYDPTIKDNCLWNVPIEVASWSRESLSGNNTNKEVLPSHHTKTMLTNETIEFKLNHSENSIIKLNPNQTGFYRVQYSQSLLDKLCPSIPLLPSIERVGILRDLFALSSSGRILINTALDIIHYYEKDENGSVVSTLSGNLSLLNSLHSDSSYSPLLRSLIVRTFLHNYKRLGWSSPVGGIKEDATISILRSNILSMIAIVGGDKEAQEEAIKIFRESKNDNNTVIPADLRSVIYSVVAKKGNLNDLEILYKMYYETDLQEEKSRILSVLGLVDGEGEEQLNRLNRALEFMLSDDVRSSQVGSLMSSIGGTKLGRKIGWEWFKKNFSIIKTRFCVGQNFVISGILNSLLSGNTTIESVNDFTSFFNNNPIPQANTVIKQLCETITTKANRLKREKENLQEWLEKNIK